MQRKHFAVLGHPIGHSMSPFIHSRLLPLAGAQGDYETVDVAPQDLPARFAKLCERYDGFNVTAPLKTLILPLLDEIDPAATAFGSVNTVRISGGKSQGCSTDGLGFTRALAAAGLRLQGQVLLLGGGGVARVSADAILRAPSVTGLTFLLRRHPEERLDPAALLPAQQLQGLAPWQQNRLAEDAYAQRHGKDSPWRARARALLQGPLAPAVAAAKARDPAFPIRVMDAQELQARCRSDAPLSFDLLVNASSAGMYPDVAGCPDGVDAAVLSRCAAVFDEVYNPGVTVLLQRARALGKKAVGGMGMLVWQAAAAEEFWLGCRFQDEQVTPILAAAQQEMQRRFGNLILCGFMGCGKSTAGPLLAQKLGRRFVDMDAYIEAQAGRTVTQLFASEGEAGFRAREAAACRALSRQPGLVIAAGGGALLQAANAAVLKETGLVLLLDTPLEAIESRLAQDHSRPLLEGGARAQKLRALYAQRLPLYRAVADLCVSAPSSEEAADRACRLLQG